MSEGRANPKRRWRKRPVDGSDSVAEKWTPRRSHAALSSIRADPNTAQNNLNWYCSEKKESFDKRIDEVEFFFIPFWTLFVSTFRSGARANPERRQSEPRAKAEWRQPPVKIVPKRTKNRLPLLRKKSGTKWHPITITITIGMRPYFTPLFTVYKANAMTDSYIRPSVNCELWNAMIFGFLRV